MLRWEDFDLLKEHAFSLRGLVLCHKLVCLLFVWTPAHQMDYITLKDYVLGETHSLLDILIMFHPKIDGTYKHFFNYMIMRC